MTWPEITDHFRTGTDIPAELTGPTETPPPEALHRGPIGAGCG